MAARIPSPAFFAPTSLRFPPSKNCASVCAMQSLLSSTDTASALNSSTSGFACIDCSAGDDSEEFGSISEKLDGGGGGDMASRAMRQLRLLLVKALQERLRDRLLSVLVRAGLAASFGLSDLRPGAAASLPGDRSTERGTITAMDALTPLQRSAPWRCRDLLADRLRQVCFPDRCAWLLLQCQLAELLRQQGRDAAAAAAAAPARKAAPSAEAAACTTTEIRASSRSSSTTSRTRRPLPPSRRRQRRRRRSSRRRHQQRRRVSRSSRSCSTSSTLNPTEFAPQVIRGPVKQDLRPAAAAAAATALNTDGSNSCRRQSKKPAASCATGLAHFDATHAVAKHERNQHQGERHHKRHQFYRRREQPVQQQPPPPRLPPPPPLPLPQASASCQRLCQMHSTPGGFRASLKSSDTASSSCPVCASRHFLLRHLGRMVESRSTGQLPELERTLSDCLEQQRHWQRSLQWIASNVKVHRLPSSVRPVVNSCGCSEDRSC